MTISRMCVLAIAMLALGCNNKTEKQPVAKTAPEAAPVEQATGYEIVTAETEFHFEIVSNSAGPIRVWFPEGVSGNLNDDGTGTVTVQLDKMYSLDQNDLENPLRDANVVEAFFGVRPSAIFPAQVDEAWQKLTGMIQRSVPNARFEITKSEGIVSGDATTGSMTGNLVLWNKISVPLTLPVSVTRSETGIELASTEPVSFDLIEALGADLRKLTFDTMLAAGCAHQPGIQNEVTITLDKVILAKR